MLHTDYICDDNNQVTGIKTSLRGKELLNTPELNKGSAFTEQERIDLCLTGKLPVAIETIDQQIHHFYDQYQQIEGNLARNIYLNGLFDNNQTAFYKLVSEHLIEMLPIIYTPTVGEAVEQYSLEFRRPRGMYFSYPDREHMEQICENRVHRDVDIILVTDGEGVLGIGDQGVGGMDISIAKLMVYTLCAGINPNRVLPVQLDVGTNNQTLLNDPLYMGWRHERLSGQEYDDFVAQFIDTVKRKFPGVYLHWEDFGRGNARRNLDKYRDELTSFNDDIQGTGAVALACLMAGCKSIQKNLAEQNIVIFGAGSAGTGIADAIRTALLSQGGEQSDIVSRFWLIDRNGLLINDQADLTPAQTVYAHAREDVSSWNCADPKNITLADVVANVHPDILIGCSGQNGAFKQEIIEDMAAHVEHPIVMPLSNPTSLAEATPSDILEWTKGAALIATGSPFGTVCYEDRDYVVAQSNNAYVFPGLGQGVIISKAKKVTDAMIWEACDTLSDLSPALNDKSQSLLPDLADAQKIATKIALRVAEQARKQGVAGVAADVNFSQALKHAIWEPKYLPYQAK